MKRGCPDHPKTRGLATSLGLRRYQVVGLLESLWHFTSNYAKRGDIGKWSDDEIAAALDWEGEPGTLVEALVTSKFLDRCECHRLLVHDWQDHSDQTVARSEEVKTLGFASCALANTSQPKPKPKPKPKPNGSGAPTSSADPIDSELIGWCEWWNSLHERGLVSAGVDVPPGEALQKAHRRVAKSAKLRRLLSDRDAIEAQIRESPFVNDGWFRLEKLLGGTNRDGELIAKKLLEGGFRDSRTGPHRKGAGKPSARIR